MIKLINYTIGDIVYLGYNNHEKRVNVLLNGIQDVKVYQLPKNDSLNFFYGTYGYICNRKFRQHIINLGIDWFLQNNSPIDCGYNIINFRSPLKYYVLTGEQLIIPEINNNGITDRKDKEIFYENRMIHKESYIEKPLIIQTLMGGLGNQLFMLFNLISLAKDYKTSYYLDSNFYDKKRQSPNSWTLFKNIPMKDLSEIKDYTIYKEPEYIYNNIELNLNKINKLEGYFQSYKYFWHNREEIKRNIFIDNNKINLIKSRFQEFGKPILAIHLRLTDYLEFKNYHPIPTIEYYKKALSYYNLNKYQIILFSDDSILAKEKIAELKLDYIYASDILEGDEDQFYMLCLCDIRICSNSTFTLLSCYLNEIYNFTNNSEYIFPHKWFGKKGPKYNLNDLMLNDKFSTINAEINEKKYKCVVIIYHKNYQTIYKSRWIDKFKNSILKQKNCNFDILEVNYGNKNESIFHNDFGLDLHSHKFYVKNYNTHTEALLFLLDKCFKEYNYDRVFNTNIDDYYHMNRLEQQLLIMEKDNSLINSSGWTYIIENEKNNREDVICNYLASNIFSIEDNKFKSVNVSSITNTYNDINKNINLKNITTQLNKNNNIINHPTVCFAKELWDTYDIYGNYLRYRDDKPFEDLSFWRRIVNSNLKISIINKNLLYYRIHANQITKLNSDCKISYDLNKTRIGILLTDKNIDILENKYIFKYNIFWFVLNLTAEKLKKYGITKYKSLNNLILEDIQVYFQLYSDIIIYYTSNNIDTILIKFNNGENYSNKLEEIRNGGIYIDRASDFISYIKIHNNDVYQQLECNSKNNFSDLQLKNKTIIFYTLIYKIKSKFDFNIYVEWGKNLLSNLQNQQLVIFTNNETLSIINHLIEGNPNIHICLRELSEFKYNKYKDILIQNTNKIFFPNHDIDYKLILIWLERHIMIQQVMKEYDFNFYCHIDWGYFRDNTVYNNFCNQNLLNKLEENKIYFALIRNDIPYLKKIINYLQDNNNLSNNIHKIITENLWSIGGGISIMNKKNISWWLKIYQEEIQKFIKKKFYIKDDQVILINVIFNSENITNFTLLTDKKHIFDVNRCKTMIQKKYSNKYKRFSNQIYYYQKICEEKIQYALDLNNKYPFDLKNLDKLKSINNIKDEWFPFKNFLSSQIYKLDYNKNIKLLFMNFELINEKLESKFLINDNNLIKVYKNENRIKIFFNKILETLTYNNIIDLNETFIYCTKLKNNGILNNNILGLLEDIFMFILI